MLTSLSHRRDIHLERVEMAYFVYVQMPYFYYSFEGESVTYIRKFTGEKNPNI